jgi:hypothetical protein
MSKRKYMYEIVKEDGHFLLVEKKTGNVIEKHEDMSLARKRSKFMSSGGAFNTFTPAFICLECLPQYQELAFLCSEQDGKNVNESFQKLLSDRS